MSNATTTAPVEDESGSGAPAPLSVEMDEADGMPARKGSSSVAAPVLLLVSAQ